MGEEPVIGASRTLELMGARLHYVDYRGVDYRGVGSGPTMVLVHGLGGSHLNWDLLAPRLAGAARVFALDLPGFGLSAPTGRPATVRSNLRVLTAFVERIVQPPVVLVGNSMGGVVSILVTADRPDLVRNLVLLDPALPAAGGVLRSPADVWTLAIHAVPGIGELVRRTHRDRIGALATVRETLHRCGVDEASLPAGLLERSVALAARQSEVAGLDRAHLSASRSLAWTLARTRRYYSAMASITAPVLLVHGTADGMVPVAAARTTVRRYPAWSYQELEGAGHLPQLQFPDRVAGLILDWLDESAPPGHQR